MGHHIISEECAICAFPCTVQTREQEWMKTRQDLEPSLSHQLWESKVQMTQECRCDEGFLW